MDEIAHFLPSLRALFDDLFEGVQVLDSELRYLYLNNTAARHGRATREELVGRRMAEKYPGIDQTEMYGLLLRCLEGGEPQRMINHFAYPDGGRAWFDLRISRVPMGVMVFSFDVSAQKELEESLRRSREELAATLECMGEAVITTDLEGRVTLMNPAAERLSGWPRAEALGRPLDSLVSFLSQRSLKPVDHPVARVLREGLKIGLANGTVLVARDGRRVPIASSGAPIRDLSGALSGVVMAIRDMSEEYELTSQLQAAQKMEAVGLLAGGIAHDFNNLITVISGFASMGLEGLAPGDPLEAELKEIQQAGDKAAQLTRQLLAFGRRQVLVPASVGLNGVVEGMGRMLKRLLGENIDLVTRLQPGLGSVLFDPGQIEQIIMNLAVNARDAMPRGGKLTIETADVELDEAYAGLHAEAKAGPHVMLAISDTGQGMDEATRARIFEPFFTTKQMGRGTGLGLSTVWGIVRQSGGNIWVYSEPGRGTSFKVYIPREPAGAAGETSPAPAAEAGTGAARGLGETILLVEDEEGVRKLLHQALEKAGYRVLRAGDAEEALALFEKAAASVDLLLTDVVLPGLSGRALADRALAIKPGLKVAYMSGYTDNAIVHQGVLEEGTHFVQKPFSPAVLLRRIREFLA